jgi:hypothetical protein
MSNSGFSSVGFLDKYGLSGTGPDLSHYSGDCRNALLNLLDDLIAGKISPQDAQAVLNILYGRCKIDCSKLKDIVASGTTTLDIFFFFPMVPGLFGPFRAPSPKNQSCNTGA